MSGRDDFSLRFELLDRQLVDADGLPFGRVDDLEIDVVGDEPHVSGILTGSQALGERMGGTAGAAIGGLARALRRGGGPEPEGGVRPLRLDIELVAEREPQVKLKRPLRELPPVAGLERWLARHLIGRFPGSGDAGL